MADLIDYLHARLDEDEAFFRRLSDLARGTWPETATESRVHPDQLLAEVTAKRRLVRLHRPLWPDADEPRCFVCADPRYEMIRAPWPCVTLLSLAQPYQRRPGFHPSWRLPGPSSGTAS
jgi:hypothetical protein